MEYLELDLADFIEVTGKIGKVKQRKYQYWEKV